MANEPVNNEPVQNEPEKNEQEQPMRPNPFRDKVEALSERAWKCWQAVTGVALGIGCCCFLYGGNGGVENTWSTIYALMLALIVPKLAEQSCGRSVLFGKKVMLGTIIVGLVYVFVSWGIRTGFHFT